MHEEFIVSEADVPEIGLLVHHHDGPFGDSSAIPTYLVSKMARSRVTVCGSVRELGSYASSSLARSTAVLTSPP